MSGKHLNRALRVHKVRLEVLEKLLNQKFEQSLPETERLSQNTGLTCDFFLEALP